MSEVPPLPRQQGSEDSGPPQTRSRSIDHDGVYRYANGALLDSILGPPESRETMADSLLAGTRPEERRRIALLVKNLNPTGGNRVILRLFDHLQASPLTEMHVLVVPETKPHIGALADLIACKRRYRTAASVGRAWRPVKPEAFDVVLSTSRRTLDFVRDFGHPAHVHLLQAIEAWDTVNSASFCEFCVERGYPTPEECVDLVRRIGISHDVWYLDQVAAAGGVLAVSDYLRSAVRYLTGSDDTKVSIPEWHIKGDARAGDRSIDALFFVRGFGYNGDALAIEVMNAMPPEYRVTVVAARRARAEVKAIRRRSGVSIVREPPDAVLAELFASSRVVVHPSLCNGGGSIPIEALALGCSVVASRTGWLLGTQSEGPLTIVDRHDPQEYLSTVLRVLAPRGLSE